MLTKLQTTEASYTYQRDGVFYFSRRVPEDLKKYYKYRRIVVSLRTRSRRAAKVKSITLAAQLDDEWLSLRWRSKGNPLRHFLVDQSFMSNETSSAPLLSEAKHIYMSAKAGSRPLTFTQAADRSVQNLIDVAGDKPLDVYSRQDANRLRDILFDRGLAIASVKRMFGTLRALINFVTKEHGIEEVNVFSGVYLGEVTQGESIKRQPIPLKDIRAVQHECNQVDDECRWLISLISDSGMRLSEATGLHKSDLRLDGKYPHIVLKPHPWRRLKTKGSERIVPLVGSALWAATEAYQSSLTDFLFPRY